MNPLSVLLVEDRDGLRASFLELFEKTEHRVVCVEGLATARWFLARQQFDVIVTDSALSAKAGQGVVDAARTRNPRTRIVAVSRDQPSEESSCEGNIRFEQLVSAIEGASAPAMAGACH